MKLLKGEGPLSLINVGIRRCIEVAGIDTGQHHSRQHPTRVQRTVIARCPLAIDPSCLHIGATVQSAVCFTAM